MVVKNALFLLSELRQAEPDRHKGRGQVTRQILSGYYDLLVSIGGRTDRVLFYP